ncbi:hypothetical protein PN451_09665 [Dolichospermum planctonicum CS-1226]|uniref:Effector-associated domain-containing protein n=1 Tax=Dolichospermum planctonicum CS-1226 TaxID=3021751 RepID=A0ABT5AFL9_9CYAN|nr:EAD6 domain-containing conflict system protein [Dolichospermum planctonicum]MDB9536097.1 hypothetical protein [Dolichospermum planctonicum CS-1226]
MSSHQLTIIQLDLVNSSQSFKDLFEKYDLENEILRAFIRKIEAIVKPAFDKSTNTYNIDSNLTKIEMAMADGYRLIFQFPQNAYEFVQIFCELVNERNQKPGIDQWMFRFGAATDPDINYDPEAINKFTGYGFLKAKELEAGAFPGWLFVDEMTYSKLSQDIQNKFSKQSFKNKHNESREAYGYPMLANYVQPIKPIIWTDEKRKNLRNQIQNTFTEQQLKDILTENEQTLKRNLYDVVEGTTYQSKLINLVRYLHQNDLINTFLKILGNENQNFASQINSLFDD